jgi:signal transduction histidine kinase/CheY-like chemotaxis protein
VRRADGAYRWAIDAAAARFGPGGAYLGYVGSVIDIDERREAEVALRESTARAEALAAEQAAILGQLGEGVIVTDPAGRITFVNEAAARIHGVARLDVGPDDYAPTYRLSRVDGSPYPSDELPLARAVLAGETVVDARWRIHRPDGTEVLAIGNARPVLGPDGERLGAVLTVRDDTERDASERALRDLNETLEDRVAERTAELEDAHEALRQAQKMEAVGQLTGGIAHDFNNLLTGVIGSLDLMQRKIAAGRTGEIERHVSAAITSANRAAALTHRLLAFSRRQPLDPRPVDANRLVTSMEELIRRTIGESVQLEMVTAGGLWQTLCDPHQLENAVLNLAINARDAMPEGGKLTIETCNAHLDSAYAARSRDVRPGQYICICVSDTGTGMAKEVIDKAFEPFFTTKPIGQGTGLGLSMIYGFARQSDGYAKIYSEVGDGTTIKIYLPRHYGEAPPPETGDSLRLDDVATAQGEIVLVVEDETAVRDLVVEVLGDLGYRTIEAADGPSGLRLLQSDQRIDLLVTDVGLPGLNGRQVADAARLTRPDLKILFMTGYAENAAINGGFLDPGMELLTKPFAIDALADKIRAMIERG